MAQVPPSIPDLPGFYSPSVAHAWHLLILASFLSDICTLLEPSIQDPDALPSSTKSDQTTPPPPPLLARLMLKSHPDFLLALLYPTLAFLDLFFRIFSGTVDLSPQGKNAPQIEAAAHLLWTSWTLYGLLFPFLAFILLQMAFSHPEQKIVIPASLAWKWKICKTLFWISFTSIILLNTYISPLATLLSFLGLSAILTPPEISPLGSFLFATSSTLIFHSTLSLIILFVNLDTANMLKQAYKTMKGVTVPLMQFGAPGVLLLVALSASLGREGGDVLKVFGEGGVSFAGAMGVGQWSWGVTAAVGVVGWRAYGIWRACVL